MLILFIIVMTLLVSMIPWFMHHGLPFSATGRPHQKFNFYRKAVRRSPDSEDSVAPVFDFDIGGFEGKDGAAEPFKPPNEKSGEQKDPPELRSEPD